MRCQRTIDKCTIVEYLKRKNIDGLETHTFGGQGVSYSVADLTDEQKMHLKACKLAMKQAKKTAAAAAENKVFENLLEKF